MQKEKILVTGGSGLVGTHLTRLLIKENYRVVHLARKRNSRCGVKVYLWDLKKKWIEDGAFENVSHIIHLAGEPIVAQKWTEEQKQKIISSRSASQQLLLQYVSEKKIKLQTYLSASGINYYGTKTTDTIFTESNLPGQGFVSECVIAWEAAADIFTPVCRVVKLRTGMVLDKNEGALPQLAAPVRWGLGAPLGTGKQYIPWIHIEDLCRMYLFALRNPGIIGAYNAVAPEHITNMGFTQILAKAMKKPLWLPNIPGWFIKLLLGNRSELVLNGSRASCDKILNEGFQFIFPTLEKAATDFTD